MSIQAVELEEVFELEEVLALEEAPELEEASELEGDFLSPAIAHFHQIVSLPSKEPCSCLGKKSSPQIPQSA